MVETSPKKNPKHLPDRDPDGHPYLLVSVELAGDRGWATGDLIEAPVPGTPAGPYRVVVTPTTAVVTRSPAG